MVSARRIGAAIGVLMNAQKVTEHEAFDMLGLRASTATANSATSLRMSSSPAQPAPDDAGSIEAGSAIRHPSAARRTY